MPAMDSIRLISFGAFCTTTTPPMALMSLWRPRISPMPEESIKVTAEKSRMRMAGAAAAARSSIFSRRMAAQ